MSYHTSDQANEDFFNHYNVIELNPLPMNESIDQIINGKEYLAIRESRRLSDYEIVASPKILSELSLSPEDKALPEYELIEKVKRLHVYEGIIVGDKLKLEQAISEDIGHKVIIVPVEE